MFGIDMIDMVPAGTIQDLVRDNGADVLRMVMQGARTRYELQPGEKMSFQFFEHVNKEGQPTVLCMPIVLDAQLRTVRKLPYYDLVDLLNTAPIAEWVAQGKAAKKTMDKLEPLLTKLSAAQKVGNAAQAQALTLQVEGLLERLPAPMRRLMAVDAMLPRPAAPPAQLAPAADPEPFRLNTAPAAETGDTFTEQPGPATDGE